MTTSPRPIQALRMLSILMALSLAGCGATDTQLDTTNHAITDTSSTSCTQTQTQLDNANQQIANLQAQLTDANTQIVELQKNKALKSWIPLLDLATDRNFTDLPLVENLETVIGDDDSARLAFMHLTAITPSQYDRALWSSLYSIAVIDPSNLQVLRDQLIDALNQGTPIASAYISLGAVLGMTSIDLNNWKALAG